MLGILETLTKVGGLKTFIMLLKIAHSAEPLDTEGPYTVLAPLDEAFEELPTKTMDQLLNGGERLTNFLDNHLVLGDLITDDLRENPLLETVAGDKLLLDIFDNTLMINDQSTIVQPNISFIGGEVQVIDAVLLPKGE
jgi:uncharacterized surface protein with fasciclin (FAS1) repeats